MSQRDGDRKSSPGFLAVAPGSSGSSFSCASSCSGSGLGSGSASASSSEAALVRRRGQGQAGRGHHVHHAVNPALVDTLHLAEDDVVISHPRGPRQPHHHHPQQHSTGTQVHDLDGDTLDSGPPAARLAAASPNSYLSMPSVKQFPRWACGYRPPRSGSVFDQSRDLLRMESLWRKEYHQVHDDLAGAPPCRSH